MADIVDDCGARVYTPGPDVTYETYYRLEKAVADDPREETRAARTAIARRFGSAGA